jgi:hypothetical protein
MNDSTPMPSTTGQTPWHVWAIAVLGLLWYGSGAYTIIMAQWGRLAGLSADEAAYYAAQTSWLVLSTRIGLFAALSAVIALLLRHRAAVWLFALSLVAILGNNAFELASGTSRALVSRAALVVTSVIIVFAILLLLYSRAMTRRAILR